MRVQFLRQAYPKGGGMLIAAGTVADLDAEALAEYPRGSWRRLPAAKQATTPADKQVTGDRNK